MLALGKGFGLLHDEQGTRVEHSVDSVLEQFGRWGRNPDDVADWMLFSPPPQVSQEWCKPLSDRETRIGPKAATVAGIAERYSAIVIWALDGYGTLPISAADIRDRLMPAAAVLKLRVAENHELMTE